MQDIVIAKGIKEAVAGTSVAFAEVHSGVASMVNILVNMVNSFELAHRMEHQVPADCTAFEGLMEEVYNEVTLYSFATYRIHFKFALSSLQDRRAVSRFIRHLYLIDSATADSWSKGT